MLPAKVMFKIRNRHFLLLDVVLFCLSALFSYVIRLDVLNVVIFQNGLIRFFSIAVPIKLLIFVLSGMYSRYWRNAGPSELMVVAFANALSTTIITVIFSLILLIRPDQRNLIPFSLPLIDGLMTFLFVLISRFSLRAIFHLRLRQRSKQVASAEQKRVLIIGAGQTGVQVKDTLERTTADVTIVGFLDDDPNKVGIYLRGFQVLGQTDALATIVETHQVNLVILALPSAPGNVIRKIAAACRDIKVDHQIVPSIYELIMGKINVTALRPISIDDLLRRDPVSLNVEDIRDQLKGQVVMVTGAGGSIGTELCHQIAKCNPARLIMVGRGENSLFAAEQKLKGEFPSLKYQLVLVDIQNKTRMEAIFARYTPNVVFHAAAHKHVPMLESNVCAAVNNNVMGTANIIDLCNKFTVKRMVMISTDKAVDPTSVMGMSKRAAELLMLRAAYDRPERFAVVRFGNVLGSRGSVVPIFQQQIAAGGPVTVTSEEMTRYFMSIPEAALLVLKAGVLVKDGPLFVLNMGEPVSILDLANELIRLQGLQPGHDIEVKITGLRPGEKLYENLFWKYEAYRPVEHGTIFSLEMKDNHYRQFVTTSASQLDRLISEASKGNDENVRQMLADIMCQAPSSTAHAGSYEIPSINTNSSSMAKAI